MESVVKKEFNSGNQLDKGHGSEYERNEMCCKSKNNEYNNVSGAQSNLFSLKTESASDHVDTSMSDDDEIRHKKECDVEHVSTSFKAKKGSEGEDDIELETLDIKTELVEGTPLLGDEDVEEEEGDDNESGECGVLNQKEDNKRCVVVGKEHATGQSSDQDLKCEACQKVFVSKRCFLRHMKIHNTEKSFECSMCGKMFREKSKLEVHMRIHTGEKPYKCSVCNNDFSRKDSLLKHLRIHTGEKPFKCTVCGKDFTGSSNMHNHMKTHTGEKPFKCTICDKAFSHNNRLQYHLKTHSGEKAFNCTLCDKGFSRNIFLQKHIRAHSGEKPYTCSICGHGFAQNMSLQHHLIAHQHILAKELEEKPEASIYPDYMFIPRC